MQLHEKGAKSKRDRARCIQKYHEIVDFFGGPRVSDAELAKLSVNHLYQLGEAVYNRQTIAKKRKYAEHLRQGRRRPLAFRWFRHDLIAYKHPGFLGWLWINISAPFRYPGYLKRKKAREAAEQAA